MRNEQQKKRLLLRTNFNRKDVSPPLNNIKIEDYLLNYEKPLPENVSCIKSKFDNSIHETNFLEDHSIYNSTQH